MRHVATVLVVVLLLTSVYLGLSNAKDIVNTITIWQRLVGVTATAYGITALVALYALWRRRFWLAQCLALWAILVVLTVAQAAAVYDRTPWAILRATLISALVVAPVVLYGLRQRATT